MFGCGAPPLAPGQKRVVGPRYLAIRPAREDLATPAPGPRPSRRALPSRQWKKTGRGCRCHGRHRCRYLWRYSLCAHANAKYQRSSQTALCANGRVLATGLPVWCAGAAAPPSVASLTFVNWQQPIACGGVAVFPGDAIVADGDGAVVIPRALLNEVVDLAAEQEKLEALDYG